jgi:hypothetical protein
MARKVLSLELTLLGHNKDYEEKFKDSEERCLLASTLVL